MPERENFEFERSRGIIWVCDLANSSRYLNDNASASDLEEFLPRFFWIASGLVEAAGGQGESIFVCYHCSQAGSRAPRVESQAIFLIGACPMCCAPFAVHFADLPDPRIARSRQHLLLDIVVLTLCALLSGVEGWEDIEQYGRAKQAWLRERLGLALPHGIPSDDTLRRVFAALDPVAFTRCFSAWVETVRQRTQGEVIALDGKCLRGSLDAASGQSALHLVSAWACANRLVLGAQVVADKSNEIPAVVALLALLDVAGGIVTADALHTQKATVTQIVARHADYVLPVKDNQPHLRQDIEACLTYQQQQRAPSRRIEVDTRTRVAHGRVEHRRCAVLFLEAADADWGDLQAQWPGLRALIEMRRTRCVGQKVSEETTYYISSLSTSASHLNQVIRRHWHIENKLHYVLDTAFGEDACLIRRDNAPANLSMMRQVALNLLQRESSAGSIRGKKKRAGWDNDFLLAVLLS